MEHRHITFLISDIHFGGGGERVSTNMANYFVSQGNAVSIVSISHPKPHNSFFIDKHVKIDYLNINLNSRYKLLGKIESIFAVRKYFSLVKSKTFVLAIGTYPALLLAMLPNLDCLIKIGCQHNSYSATKHLWFIFRFILFRRLNCLISLTSYDAPKLKKLNKKVFIIPNSIFFSPDEPAKLENKTILSIGRLDYLKGYDLLIEMFERYCTLNKDWKLRIIGDGPLLNQIKKIILEKGLSKRISLITKSNAIMDEYLDASIYVMTSRSEGLPMVLLEAQAFGIPIVAFDCETGPSEIIQNGINGYLISNFDIEAMIEKLTELCNDPFKRLEFGRNSLENIKRFNPEEIFNKWELVFRELEQSH